MPLISALSKQRQVDLSEFWVSLVYTQVLSQSGLPSEALAKERKFKKR